MRPVGAATVYDEDGLRFFEEVSGYDEARGIAESYASLFFRYTPYGAAVGGRYFYRPSLMEAWERLEYGKWLEKLEAWRSSVGEAKGEG